MCTTSTVGARHERRRMLKDQFGRTERETEEVGLRVDPSRRTRLHTSEVMAAYEEGHLEDIGSDDLLEIRRLPRTTPPIAEQVPSFKEIRRDAGFHFRLTQAEEIRRWAAENLYAAINIA